ncbi:Phenylacetaldehyde dehydrogenase [Hyphodiscus hymeniophilus]|uniref:aldehyde dehydrogenase (NAD(+)) n=1 Tax=Hyphodiscus hymeniophilus TaxID=353542 RepID=A0A9P6VNJ9_9HELO|nr:Phenylacetaldehyde dehydrogenase [Hyphodiscus hymeniophilus]
MADTIRSISPVTGKCILERQGSTLEQAKEIVLLSNAAFLQWRSVPLSERIVIVTKAMELIHERREELAEDLTFQMGRPIRYTVGELNTMQVRAKYLISIAETTLEDTPCDIEQGFKRRIAKVPLGPALLVFAWNYPYLIVVNSLIPALLAGNSVILKPSPQTPKVGDSLVEIFSKAGLPKNVLSVLHSGSNETLAQIVKLPDIKLITFTGSTAGGHAIRNAVSDRLVPICLELGGNDPAYVRPDVDLAHVAGELVDGAVFNSGQSCCSIERIYVHQDVYDDFVEAVQVELMTFATPAPQSSYDFYKTTMLGPVISPAAVANIHAHIADALAKGAKDVTPNNPSFTDLPKTGSFIAPVVLTNTTHRMRVMMEETFGPVIPIMKVANDEEAIKLMNDSDYGLTASIWTKDIAKGEELIEQLEAGTVFVNRADFPNADLAWTGWKNSGLGVTLGPFGFNGFFKLKSYHVKESQT